MAAATQMMSIGAISPRIHPEFNDHGYSPYGLPIADDCASHSLRSNGLSCVLSAESMHDLDRISHPTSYPAEALLFVEGQAARGVYILCHGRAKLMTTNRDGKTLILKIAEPGEIIGLDAIISGRPYEFTAETLHASQLAFVSREDFLRFLRSHGDACLYATQHLSRDCQAAYDTVRSMGLCHSVSEKLARLVLHWSAESKSSNGANRIKVALTHEEIAQLIGSSRETITRILGEFRKKKLIEVNGSTMLVRNQAGLEALASR